MTLNPRSAEVIYETIRLSIVSAIDKMTNFVDGGFNDRFIQSYSDQMREAEIKALAAELGGYVDYAGKELDQNDLDALNVTGVEPEEINQYMDDEQLDLLAANEDIERDGGVRPSGPVVFETTDDSVEVPQGFTVSTESDSRGNRQEYSVDIEDDDESGEGEEPYITPDEGEEEVEVRVVAEEVGPGYNLPIDAITHIVNPQPGIQGVSNPDIISGGEPAQTNESLREDVRNSIFSASGGGTRIGLVSYIEENTGNDINVETEEYTDVCPSYVDVVIDGGTRSDLEELVSESRPIGVRHNVVRPTNISLGVTSDIVGIGVDSDDPYTAIVDFIDELDMGDDFSWSSLLSETMNSNTSIETVPSLNTYVTDVERERFAYDVDDPIYTLQHAPLGYVSGAEVYYSSTTDEYPLRFTDVDEETVVVEASVDGLDEVLERGSAYTIEHIEPEEDDVDPYNAIVIQNDPGIDDESILEVGYQHSDIAIERVETVDGDPLLEGEHFSLIDSNDDGQYDSIELHSVGSRVNNGERVEISYRPGSQFDGDISVDNRQKLLPDATNIDVDIHSS